MLLVRLCVLLGCCTWGEQGSVEEQASTSAAHPPQLLHSCLIRRSHSQPLPPSSPPPLPCLRTHSNHAGGYQSESIHHPCQSHADCAPGYEVCQSSSAQPTCAALAVLGICLPGEPLPAGGQGVAFEAGNAPNGGGSGGNNGGDAASRRRVSNIGAAAGGRCGCAWGCLVACAWIRVWPLPLHCDCEPCDP